MIRLLTGQVASSEGGQTVLAVGGVGYLLFTLNRLVVLEGENLQLHTYLAVRETAMDLYGFKEEKELEFFKLLLTIPKIGPKSAMQILDQATVELLHEAISMNDAVHLTKLSGIGKKTAEKIVAGLQNKVEALPEVNTEENSGGRGQNYHDAFDTLITLGYDAIQVRQVLDSMDNQETTSNLVKTALKQLH